MARTAVGYVRCSTAKQEESGLGLESQLEKVRAFCVVKGWELVHVYEEPGVSAGKPLADRPEGAKLLARVRKEKCAVVVAKLDRLFRNVADASATINEFAKQNIELAAIAEGFDMSSLYGRAMAQMASVFAELERGMIRERTRAAVQVKKSRGERVSGLAPYGWTFVGTGVFKTKFGETKETLQLEPLPSEQETLTLIRLWHSNGIGFEGIAKTLNSTNTPTKTGTLWTRATVRQILRRAG